MTTCICFSKMFKEYFMVLNTNIIAGLHQCEKIFLRKTLKKKIKDNARYVYIVGHSLALSDRYILLDIIEKSDKIRIYYFNEEDKKSKITNLYKILGDEKFYEYVNNDSAKHRIVLRPQSDIEINYVCE